MSFAKGFVDRLMLCAFAIVFVAPAVLLVVKPSIDNTFHADYLANLVHLGSLTNTLEREQRNVRRGLTPHYDFLEGTLADMEASAQLVALHPSFVDVEYETVSQASIEAYLDMLKQLRKEVEATKRFTGLLRNSRRSMDNLLDQQVQLLSGEGKIPLYLVKLYDIMTELDADANAVSLLASFNLSVLPASQFAQQIAMHINVLVELTPLLETSSARFQQLLRDTTQPAEITAAYQAQYFAAVNATHTVLLASYGVFGLLLSLALLQLRRARSARVEAERIAIQLNSQLEETRTTVEQCKSVLEGIANGRFDRRVMLRVDGDLGQLCASVNASADRVEETVREVERIMASIINGHFEVQVDGTIQSGVREAVAEAMFSLQSTFSAIKSAMSEMAAGRFSARVSVDAKGDLKQLKDSVNESMAALQAAIEDISSVVLAQAEGVLTSRIERQFPGGLGVLAQSVDESSAALCHTLNAVRSASESVGLAARQVDQSAGSVTQAVQQQMEAIRSARDTTGEISVGVERSTAAITLAGKLAVEASEKASEGERVVGTAQVAMNSIIVSSGKIEKIVGVIESIAVQINLLSLNAAVEAARAQEHGSGFAVVANEVRNLALQSAEASSNIKHLIEESVVVVHRGAADVRATGTALEGISGVVGKLNEIFQQVADSNREQGEGTERILQYMQRLDELGERNCDLANDNSESSRALDDDARRMLQMLDHFQIDEETVRAA